jgi:hypothetical protein
MFVIRVGFKAIPYGSVIAGSVKLYAAKLIPSTVMV